MKKKKVIVLVEDDDLDADLITRELKKNQFPLEVLRLTNGQELMDYLDANDLENLVGIWMDLNMPKVGGLDSLKWLRSSEKYHSLPVIVLSSSKNERDIIASYQLGANAYVSKPVNRQEFQKTMEAMVQFWGQVNLTPNLREIRQNT
ncbi:MAG: response regulator [Bacteroidota bacterium]